jgi:hypothetical protein
MSRLTRPDPTSILNRASSHAKPPALPFPVSTTLIIFLQRLAGFGVIAIVVARAAMLVPIPPVTDGLSGSVVAQAIGSEGPEPAGDADKDKKE